MSAGANYQGVGGGLLSSFWEIERMTLFVGENAQVMRVYV